MTDKSIFNKARGIEDSVAREEYLLNACAGDPEGLNRVRSLLNENEANGSFLESPPVDIDTTHAMSSNDRIGDRIGRYKLLQAVGEGGMGTVYMAEQQHPVKRRVALKVIKAGMDSKQVIARFEAERQALALMDHPNIARLLDVGMTDHGRPYFVMELVKGIPITNYCDEKRLNVRQRFHASYCQTACRNQWKVNIAASAMDPRRTRHRYNLGRWKHFSFQRGDLPKHEKLQRHRRRF